jgi:hypothetical protein
VLAVTLVPAIALTLRFVRRSQSRSGETGRG